MRPCYRRRIRKKERSHLNTRRPTLSSPGSHSSLNDPARTVINQRVHARLHKAYIRGRDHGETEEIFRSPVPLQELQLCTHLPVIDTMMSNDQNANSLTTPFRLSKLLHVKLERVFPAEHETQGQWIRRREFRSLLCRAATAGTLSNTLNPQTLSRIRRKTYVALDKGH